MKCQHCNDTGKRLGSDYLDCSCPAATDRVALEQFAGDFYANYNGMTESLQSDTWWAVHQRARQLERLTTDRLIGGLLRDWKTGIRTGDDVVVELFKHFSSTPTKE